MKNNNISPLLSIPGIGNKTLELLHQMHIETIEDLQCYAPSSYIDLSVPRTLQEGRDGLKSAYILKIETPPQETYSKNKLLITKFQASDTTGIVTITFFNQKHIKYVFKVGEKYRFFGKLESKFSLEMNSPLYEKIDATPLEPFLIQYTLPKGISSKNFTKWIMSSMEYPIDEYLPQSLLDSCHLLNRKDTYYKLHFPKTTEDLALAQKRLQFDELYFFALALQIQEQQKKHQHLPSLQKLDLTPFLNALPYELTSSQISFLEDLKKDFSSPSSSTVTATHRILTGDVGSGKTVCAMAAFYLLFINGFQACLMAPTEVLAQQHFQEMKPFFEQFGFHVALLTSSTSKKEREEILQGISLKQHQIHLLIGTQALLQDSCQFSNLLLIVIDEQHRFGIRERSTLEDKTFGGHLLVMSATPIPRTLALSLFGQIKVSSLTVKPKGRVPIKTYVVDESYRERILNFILKQVQLHHQVYVVCSSISDQEELTHNEINLQEHREVSSRKTVLQYTSFLKETFPNLRISCLHGKMSPEEKTTILDDFSNGTIEVLVSTTVIEVGVNIPNATLMVIEDAQNFGLAQLHQLRGRVGRSSLESYCVLFCSSSDPTSYERLKYLETHDSGLQIAEYDLQIRGPGDLFTGAKGTNFHQSGKTTFKYLQSCDDLSLLTRATDFAKQLLNDDPMLQNHVLLKQELMNRFDSFENNQS